MGTRATARAQRSLQLSVIGGPLLLMLQGACGGAADETSACRVTCASGCATMSWDVSCEDSGPVSEQSTCTRTYVGNDYRETCTGTRTYESSGMSYDFTLGLDWPNCAISVDVAGLGTCTD